jgi:putative flippase GtrA
VEAEFMNIYKYYEKYRAIILYLIFGVLTTIVNILFFWIFSEKFGYSTVTSNVIAWLLSVIFAFSTNKTFVFESKSKETYVVFKELYTFIAFRLLSGGLDTIIMFTSVDLLHYDKLLTKLISNIIVVILNYIASKLFIFKKV